MCILGKCSTTEQHSQPFYLFDLICFHYSGNAYLKKKRRSQHWLGPAGVSIECCGNTKAAHSFATEFELKMLSFIEGNCLEGNSEEKEPLLCEALDGRVRCAEIG